MGATMTRAEQFAYLCVEHACLRLEHQRLMQVFEELERANAPLTEWTAHALEVQAHQGLLANHRIALQWTRNPPWGRTRRHS